MGRGGVGSAGGARAQSGGGAGSGAGPPGLDGALRGSATTADAAYALAVSAVTELARRNPDRHRSTPLLQRLHRGTGLRSSGAGDNRADHLAVRAGWQRRLRQRYSLATWLLAGGGWGVLALVALGLGPASPAGRPARRAALDEGWEIPPESAAASELDPAPER